MSLLLTGERSLSTVCLPLKQRLDYRPKRGIFSATQGLKNYHKSLDASHSLLSKHRDQT